MEEACRQLASTGISSQLLIVISTLTIAASTVLMIKSRRRVLPYTMFFIVLFSLSTFSKLVSAQSIESCNTPDGNQVVSSPQANSIYAVDDGPFISGTEYSNNLLISILDNDSAGSSSFDLVSVDLNPSTVEVDTYFYYDNGVISGSFTYLGLGVVSFSPSYVEVGSTIAIPYIVKSLDNLTTNSASITIQIADWVAQGDVFASCNYPGVDSIDITSNDSHPSGINTATVDLDPQTPGQQSVFTSPKGTVFTITSPGVVQVTIPDEYTGNLTNFFDSIYYTVENGDGAVSNSAPITIVYGACG